MISDNNILSERTKNYETLQCEFKEAENNIKLLQLDAKSMISKEKETNDLKESLKLTKSELVRTQIQLEAAKTKLSSLNTLSTLKNENLFREIKSEKKKIEELVEKHDEKEKKLYESLDREKILKGKLKKAKLAEETLKFELKVFKDERRKELKLSKHSLELRSRLKQSRMEIEAKMRRELKTMLSLNSRSSYHDTIKDTDGII